MEKSILIVTFLSSLLLSSCGISAPHLTVFRGNQDYIKGNFQEANLKYFQALENPGKFEEWVYYNLGNAYFALGESTSAEAEWIRAVETGDEQLRFSTFFNLGVFYYEDGRYEDAYRFFRKALEINPGVMDAKRNLELALEKMETREAAESVSATQQTPPQDKQQDYADRVLEYVKRKEEKRWTSPAVSEESGPVNDW